MGSMCESCINFSFDEDDACYFCEKELDEDEMGRFITDTFSDCPYYSFDDEYRIVRRQM